MENGMDFPPKKLKRNQRYERKKIRTEKMKKERKIKERVKKGKLVCLS